jgi:capsular exopolysaccharide synthesis family protein
LKEKQMEFWRIYRLLRARKWLIFGIFLIAILLIGAGLFWRAQRKVWVAEAVIAPKDLGASQLLVQASGINPANPAESASLIAVELASRLRGGDAIHQKAAELLTKNEADRKRVAEEILEQNGNFAELDQSVERYITDRRKSGELTEADAIRTRAAMGQSGRARLIDTYASGRDKSGSFGTDALKESQAVILENIREKMEFSPVPSPLSTENTPLYLNQVRISAEFDREAEAQLYANTVLLAFLDYYTRFSTNDSVTKLKKLQETKRSIETELAIARKREKEISAKNSLLTTTPDLAAKDLAAKEEEMRKANELVPSLTARLAQLESGFREIPKELRTNLSTSEDLLVREAQKDVYSLTRTLATLREKYGENNENVIAARQALASAEAALRAAKSNPRQNTVPNQQYLTMQTEIKNTRASLAAAKQQQRMVAKNLTQMRQEATTLPGLRGELEKTRQNIARLSKNLDNLEDRIQAEKYRQIDNQKSGTISIISPARTKLKDPIDWKKAALTLLYGGLLSLLLSTGIVILLDSVDNAIRTPQDAEQVMGLPICGQIPKQLPDPQRAPRIAALDPLSPVSESYRLLRTDLLFTAMDHPFQSLMVATSKPGQGATTTVCNLAITLAQSAKRVVLIDADLRRPKLHTIFHLSNEVGLTSVLNGESSVEEAIQPTDIPNLLVLTAGPLAVNPSELLQSLQMHQLHEHLKGASDFVLIDTPSAVAFSDAYILAAMVDATLLVVRANDIPRGSENYVKNKLVQAKANLIGVVLNDVDPDRVDSVHYHYHYNPVPRGGKGSGRGNKAMPSLPALEIPDEEPISATPAPSVVAQPVEEEEESWFAAPAPQTSAPASTPVVPTPVAPPAPVPSPVSTPLPYAAFAQDDEDEEDEIPAPPLMPAVATPIIVVPDSAQPEPVAAAPEPPRPESSPIIIPEPPAKPAPPVIAEPIILLPQPPSAPTEAPVRPASGFQIITPDSRPATTNGSTTTARTEPSIAETEMPRPKVTWRLFENGNDDEE